MIAAGVDDAFPAAIVTAARDLNADPLDLARVLYSESSILPYKINAIGCVGINQFCESSNRERLPGWPGVEAYARLSASAQLARFVAPWWGQLMREHGITRLTGRDIAWLNFLPALYRANVAPEYIITRDPSFVSQNPAYAKGKSYITAGDLDRVVHEAGLSDPERWRAIERAILDEEDRSGWVTLRPGANARLTVSALLAAGGLGLLAWYGATRAPVWKGWRA